MEDKRIMKFVIKPSAVGNYFETKCKRNFAWTVLEPEMKKAITQEEGNFEDKIKKGDYVSPHSDSTYAKAGDKWEEEVLNNIKKLGFKVLEEDKKNKYDLEGTKLILERIKKGDFDKEIKNKGVYLYQICLQGDNDWLNGSEACEWGRQFYPDLVKVEYIGNQYRLTVIDIKSSAMMKEGYQVQIVLYVKMLEKLVEEINKKSNNAGKLCVNKVNAYVYNRGAILPALVYEDEVRGEYKEAIGYEIKEKKFTLAEADIEINKFLEDLSWLKIENNSDNVDEILATIPCTRSSACEFCEYFNKCYEDLKKNKNYRLFPNITISAQEIADRMGIETSDDVFRILENKDNDNTKELTYDSFWADVCNNLEGYKSLINGEEKLYNKKASTPVIPKDKDYALFLTAQKDPRTLKNLLYAFKLYDYSGSEIASGEFIADSEDKWENNEQDFIDKLYESLNEINRLQIYVMDGYERINIKNALYSVLDRERKNSNQQIATPLYQKAQKILFCMPDELLVEYSDRLPDKCRENAVVVLSPVVKRLYLIKTKNVTYDLMDIADALNYEYSDGKDNFVKYVGIHNAVNFEEITKITKKDDKKSLMQHVKERLLLAKHVVDYIQSDKRVTLSARTDSLYFNNDKVDCNHNREMEELKPREMLTFALDYEVMLNRKRYNNSRTKSVEEAKEDASILELKVIAIKPVNNENKNVKAEIKKVDFEVKNYDNFKGNVWLAGILCESDDGIDNELAKFIHGIGGVEGILENNSNSSDWSIFRKYLKPIGEDDEIKAIDYSDGNSLKESKNSSYYAGFIGGKPKKDKNNNYIITLKFNENDITDFEIGKEFILIEDFVDLNASIAKTCIKNAPEEIFNPRSFFCPENVGIENDYDIDEILDENKKYTKPDNNTFSNSQKEAFVNLLERKLTVLVGPPGTGKTDFIARSILAMAAYKKSRNEKICVLVSAMSHAAIDNILFKIQEKLSKAIQYEWILKEKEGDYTLNKADKLDIEGNNKIQSNNADIKINIFKSHDKFIEGNTLTVVGATGWALNKLFDKDRGCFDLIVIDEASQVRAMDAFIQLSYGKKVDGKDMARYLLVGDNDQLPPIIMGNYERQKDEGGDVNLFGSVFSFFLSSLGENHRDVKRLSENFRMNSILCRYSAKGIYDKKLSGTNYRSYNSAIAMQKLDFEDKTVECNHDHLINDILDPEYPLVFCRISGDAVLELRLVSEIIKGLYERIGTDDPKQFWEESCGIISPYHAQINKLKTYITKALGKNFKKEQIFIGTVDKLQGQERDAVIVSYGVYDNEILKQQSEFIYSRNRFNVSITRGKKKTIVILSDVVSTPSITSNVLKDKSKSLSEGIEFVHGFAKFMAEEEHKGEKEVEIEKRCWDRIHHRYKQRWKNYNATVDVYCKKTYDTDKDSYDKNITVINAYKDMIEEVKRICKNKEEKVLIVTSTEKIKIWRDEFIKYDNESQGNVYPVDVRGKGTMPNEKNIVVWITDTDYENSNTTSYTDYDRTIIDNTGKISYKGCYSRL